MAVTLQGKTLKIRGHPFNPTRKSGRCLLEFARYLAPRWRSFSASRL